MTVTIQRRVLVALVVWAALLAGALVLLPAAASRAHTCASVKVWVPTTSVSISDCAPHDPPQQGSFCPEVTTPPAQGGVRTAACAHPPVTP